jgi:uncharacterized protein YggE
MLKTGLVFLLVSFCPLAFGQIDSNSITVSASTGANLQPDQAVFGITVQSGLTTGLDDVLAALQGSGITATNFSSVSTLPINANGSMLPLQWGFTLPVPLTNTKATVASLTTLEQNIAKLSNGLTLSFSIFGTQVSQQLAQSQTCSLSDLIAIASTQAQSLASAVHLTVGRIVALSSSTSTGVSNSGGFYAFGTLSFSTSSAVPPPCAVTVKFALTGY